MRRSVEAPDAKVWIVRRRWAPWLSGGTAGERFRRRVAVAGGNLVGGTPLHPWFRIFRVGCLVPVGLLLVLMLLVVFVVAPLVVAVVELLFVLVVGVGGLVARVLFRRPWMVEAVAGDRAGEVEVFTWRVVGWRSSGEKVDEVAGMLASGLLPTVD